MTKHKCCVCSVEDKCLTWRYDREYWLCPSCVVKWEKEYNRLRREKYPKLFGWQKWFPIFEGWVRKHQREKVVFT